MILIFNDNWAEYDFFKLTVILSQFFLQVLGHNGHIILCKFKLIFIHIVNNYRNKVSLHIHPPHSYKIFCVWLELTKPSLSNFQIHNTILQIKDTMLYITSSGLIHLSSILQPLNNYCTAFCHSRILFFPTVLYK